MQTHPWLSQLCPKVWQEMSGAINARKRQALLVHSALGHDAGWAMMLPEYGTLCMASHVESVLRHLWRNDKAVNVLADVHICE